MKHTHTETNLEIENQYSKLVRDRIPELIMRDGKTAVTHQADQAEYVRRLLDKLIEEATELKEAKTTDHQKEELADVREVLGAIQSALGFLETDIDEIQASKRQERGGFKGRIILELLPK